MQFGYTILYVDDVAGHAGLLRQGLRPAHALRARERLVRRARDRRDRAGLRVAHRCCARSARRRSAPAARQADAARSRWSQTTSPPRSSAPSPPARRSVQEPTDMPWGQTIAYVGDRNGFLVEICTPRQRRRTERVRRVQPNTSRSVQPSAAISDTRNGSSTPQDELVELRRLHVRARQHRVHLAAVVRLVHEQVAAAPGRRGRSCTSVRAVVSMCDDGVDAGVVELVAEGDQLLVAGVLRRGVGRELVVRRVALGTAPPCRARRAARRCSRGRRPAGGSACR